MRFCMKNLLQFHPVLLNFGCSTWNWITSPIFTFDKYLLSLSNCEDELFPKTSDKKTHLVIFAVISHITIGMKKKDKQIYYF